MGKGAIIAAAGISFIAIMFLSNMQLISRDTATRQVDHQSGQIARELAIKGRKLVLSDWIQQGGGGGSYSKPFSTPINENGGTIEIRDPFTLTGNVLDFTVRGTFEGAVHEIRSQFQWNGFGVNPFQVKAVKLDLEVENTTQLNLSSLALDDQGINDLDQVLIQDLGLGSSLADFNLSIADVESEILTEFSDNGISGITVNIIDQAKRDQMDSQNGMFFPDQVVQKVDQFITEHPSQEAKYQNVGSLPQTFGQSPPLVLRFEGDMVLTDHLSGQGVLIVEGNLVVPDKISFDWQGLVIVKPADGVHNPVINFEGPSNINGSLIAIHETIPNSGHMDVTSFRDVSGVWSSPHGAEMYQMGNTINGELQPNWPWWLFHTHDFTAKEGNAVVLYAPTAAERIHEDRLYFNETLELFDPNDHIFLELYNQGNHGRGILTYGLQGKTYTSYPVAAGFAPSEANPANHYRTKNFKIQDLEFLQLGVTRLSALKKMWDDSENPFPGCVNMSGRNGAVCVSEAHNRHESLTLRMYKTGDGPAKRVYETSFYWHRQEVEEEDFNNDMADLVTDLTSDDYGFDISLGDSTIITADNDALAFIAGGIDVGIGGSGITASNLGTWHRHWEAGDPDNPLYVTPSN